MNRLKNPVHPDIWVSSPSLQIQGYYIIILKQTTHLAEALAWLRVKEYRGLVRPNQETAYVLC
jgi:hypothetical protein